jgi:hypothetical protein
MRRQVWLRLGHVYAPQGDIGEMVSHAAYPTPLVLDGQVVRIYFSPRDAQNRSSIAFVDVALDGRRFALVAPPTGPLLSPGPRGAFDDSGVTVSCVLAEAELISVWYLGWSLGTTVPFRNFIGLATGTRDSGLQRVSPAPILDRDRHDPFTLGYPWVLPNDSGYVMWYGSHLGWGTEWLSMHHAIKIARSADGIDWQRNGKVVLAPAGADEYAVSRPCVLRDPDCLRMWYSRRFTTYRLGYAESADGISWLRRDDALKIVGQPGSWETDSMEYATVFDCGGRRYMLYNGNGYGRSGLGLAILEDS